MYFEKSLTSIFKETLTACSEQNDLAVAVERSICGQRFVAENDWISLPQPRTKKCSIACSNKATFQAARAYVGKRICALNFASALNPGGGVRYGCRAQEEDLCRRSTLYPAIAHSVTNPFYIRHRIQMDSCELNALYNDDLIYTPDVVIFRDDSDNFSILPLTQWVTLNVISCAAPNLNDFNGEITAGELYEIFVKRFRRILAVAAQEETEVMILGAFGCGAFGNPPQIVAEAAKRAICEFHHCFEQIEFAIYCHDFESRNYSVFRDVFLK